MIRTLPQVRFILDLEKQTFGNGFEYAVHPEKCFVDQQKFGWSNKAFRLSMDQWKFCLN